MKNGDPLLIHDSLKTEQSVVENEALICLSARDWCWLRELTDAPTKPNKQLQTAMNRYKNARRGESDTSFNW